MLTVVIVVGAAVLALVVESVILRATARYSYRRGFVDGVINGIEAGDVVTQFLVQQRRAEQARDN